MNKKIMSLALLLIGLASCNNEDVIEKGGTEILPDGYSGISIKLGTTKDAKTRALGDTLNVLTDKEKEIKSIAFFVENVDGFKSYFSDEQTDNLKMLNEPLQKLNDVTYTASVRIKGKTFGASEVVLIANYAENGLTTQLGALTSMDDLKVAMLSITNNAATPLLMYSAKNVTLKNSERLDESFDMTRMVSRIDIINLAQKATSADGFELTSARLVNAKTQAYLAGGASTALIQALPVDAAKSFSLRAAQKNAANQQVVDTLYTYENPNTDAATATAVELVGTFKNAPMVKLVKFERFNPTTKMYEPIAIQRNYRYLVEITPAKDERDVVLNIKVKDWEAADTIQAKVTKNKPTINDFALVSGGSAKITSWQGKTVRGINIKEASVTTDQILTFTTTEMQECAVEVAPVKGNNTVNPVGDVLKVEKLTTYAAAEPTGKVKTTYTVTIPKYDTTNPDNNVGLRSFLLKVVNPIDKTKYDSILVVQRIPWVDANAPAACLVKGIWWAPMNCGATQYNIITAVATTGDITPTCGKLYQWGRKYGFPANSSATYNFATSWPTQDDLPSMEENAKWKELFIKPNSSNPNTQGNWLLINREGLDNPADAGMSNTAWYQRLWNANEVAAADGTVISNPKKTAYDPCPEGWRVPTRYEWEQIKTLTPTWDSTNKYLRYTLDSGESGDQLSLPAAGRRNSSDGSSVNQGSSGNYWSSSVPSGVVDASRVYFNGQLLKSNGNSRADGSSVRCLQE